MNLSEAVSKLAVAIRNARSLPFVGAGVSSWRELEYPMDFRALANELPERPASDAGTAISIARNTCDGYSKRTCQPLFTSVNEVASFSGAPPAWFLRLCMLAMLPKKQRIRGDSKPLSSISQKLYQDNASLLASLLDHFFGEGASHRPNDGHTKLALLPGRVIVTTNYDCCLENASTVGHHAICHDGDFRKLGIGMPLVIKLHGDLKSESMAAGLDRPGQNYLDSIVLTHQQYWAFPHQPKPRQLVSQFVNILLQTHQPWFIGYSVEDFNIVELLHHLSFCQDALCRPIIILWPSNEEIVELWESRGFDVGVACDPACFIKTLWADLVSGLPGTSNHEQGTMAVPLRIQMPVSMLCLLARAEPQFEQALTKIIHRRFFSYEKMFGLSIWEEGNKGLFLNQKWIREIYGSEDTQANSHYELDTEIRVVLRTLFPMHSDRICGM